MKDLCLSELSLLVLNPEVLLETKIDAENELYRRFNKSKISFEQFLFFEDCAMEKRGFDINNYLIKKNPTMQEWIETYFTYIINCDFIHDNILFSEVHLCNDYSNNKLLNYLIQNQIKSIETTIELREFYDIKYLQFAKALLVRQKSLNDKVKKCEEAGITFVYDMYEDMNRYQLDEQMNYKLLSGNKIDSLIAKIYYSELLFSLRQTTGRMNIYRFLFQDSLKLRKQKFSLVKNSVVDYETDYMKKVLTLDSCVKENKNG